MFSQNERLTNYCIKEYVSGKILNKNTALLVYRRLSKEGYFGGLNSPETNFLIYPSIYYDDNINGGSPDKIFKVGNYEFYPAPEKVAKDDLMLGLGLALTNRLTYGEGRYLASQAGFTFARSSTYKINNTLWHIHTCSKNKVSHNYHADFCLTQKSINKELTSSDEKSTEVSLSKLSSSNFGKHELQLGFSRHNVGGIKQNRLRLKFQLMGNKQSLYSAEFKVGEPLEQTFAFAYGLNIGLDTLISGQRYSVSFSHNVSDGGTLFGITRSEVENSISLETSISTETSIALGYVDVHGSHDYFDKSYPILMFKQSW